MQEALEEGQEECMAPPTLAWPRECGNQCIQVASTCPLSAIIVALWAVVCPPVVCVGCWSHLFYSVMFFLFLFTGGSGNGGYGMPPPQHSHGMRPPYNAHSIPGQSVVSHLNSFRYVLK